MDGGGGRGMMGRVAVAALVLAGLIAGALLWWLQTRAYYDEPAAIGRVSLTLDGREVALPAQGTSIDADSSPLRYRACFTLAGPLAGTPTPPEFASPTVAPGWFECFDADAIGADLAAGRALAVLGQADVEYGIDRVAAIYPDGRGRAWHQINRCGRAVFDGEPVPEGCAPPPGG
jgi:hypothetical protein